MKQLMPPYPLIRDGLRKCRVIPFLGAGASLNGRNPNTIWDKLQPNHLPKSNELANYLARMTKFPADEPIDLTKVAQYFQVVAGRQPLHQELHNIFDCDYPLPILHQFLADEPTPLLIVTTNYDDLIERAFIAKGRVFDVVVHTTDPAIGDRLLWWSHGESNPREVIPNKIDIDLYSRAIIYKMHGAVDRRMPERDQYVITEDDYIDFLSRMIKNKAIPAIFAEPFQVRHFLFLGYGLSDWNLRVVLNRIERDLRRPKDMKSWAIQYQSKPIEQRFWQERGVELYDLTIDEFVKELELSREH